MDADDGEGSGPRGGRGMLSNEPPPMYPEMPQVKFLKTYDFPTPEEIVEIHRHLETRNKDSVYFLGSKEDPRDPSAMLERLAPQLTKYFPPELREGRLQRSGASKKRKVELDLSKLEKSEKSGTAKTTAEGGGEEGEEKPKTEEPEEDDALPQAEDEMVECEDYERGFYNDDDDDGAGDDDGGDDEPTY